MYYTPRRSAVLALLAFLAVCAFLYRGFSTSSQSTQFTPPELYGLLHMVTHPAGGSVSGMEVAHAPLALSDYKPSVTNWDGKLKRMQEEAPLVIFSKTYCPYSKKVKRLLATYDISPAPKIVEVDLREDSAEIKALLMRLTGRNTFPNVIDVRHGQSIGGSDTMESLHQAGKLRSVLENAGVYIG